MCSNALSAIATSTETHEIITESSVISSYPGTPLAKESASQTQEDKNLATGLLDSTNVSFKGETDSFNAESSFASNTEKYDIQTQKEKS